MISGVTLGFLLAGFLLGALFLFVLMRLVFRNLAAEALSRNNQSFLDLAKSSLGGFHTEAKGDLALKEQAIRESVQPLQEMLEKYKTQLAELERKRESAYGGLHQYLENVAQTQVELRKETGSLVAALRSPQVRGKWGEVSLKRVVELAGMVEHCDFRLQQTLISEHSRLRPDLIVYLPNQRQIAVDAKVPLEAYLSALESSDESEKERLMVEYSHQLKRHITQLSGKSYWEQLEGSPEFVVLFLPLESLYGAALQYNPELLERGIEKGVFVATPTTLIALLKAVEYGWKEERLKQNAEEIRTLGQDLHNRLFNLADHLSRLGSTLSRTVQTYNETVGSFERRVFVQARRFKELGVPAKEEIPEISYIDRVPRNLDIEIAEPLAAAAGSSKTQDTRYKQIPNTKHPDIDELPIASAELQVTSRG